LILLADPAVEHVILRTPLFDEQALSWLSLERIDLFHAWSF
jgi:hypothetical protein